MLNIDAKIYGFKKTYENKFQIFFNSTINKFYLKRAIHNVYKTKPKYITTNSAGNTVLIECGVTIIEREIIDEIESLTESFMKKLINNYNTKLNNINIDILIKDSFEMCRKINNN